MHGQNEDSLGDDWQGRDLLFDDSVDSIPERSESISRPPTRRLPQRTPNRARPQPEPASPTVPDEENLWGEAEVEHGEQEPIPLALPEEPPDASSPWEGPDESYSPSTPGAGYIRVESGGVYVTRGSICRGIEDDQPSEPADRYPRDVGHLYCWNLIEGAYTNRHIYHIWYWEGQKVAVFPFTIDMYRQKIWSRLQIPPDREGEWVVNTVDTAGLVLYSLRFQIE
jgi:hypothetical protein